MAILSETAAISNDPDVFVFSSTHGRQPWAHLWVLTSEYVLFTDYSQEVKKLIILNSRDLVPL
jgi:hypothetical protein